MNKAKERLQYLVSPQVDRAVDRLTVAVCVFAVCWFGGHLIAWGLQ